MTGRTGRAEQDRMHMYISEQNRSNRKDGTGRQTKWESRTVQGTGRKGQAE
jgi:hypothetical protein